MPLRRYTVYLEVCEPEIYYHFHSGGLGLVWPGGSMRSIPYDTLRALGNGTHSLELDGTIEDKAGDRPARTQDDRLFERLLFEFFAERVGVSSAGQSFSWVFLAMTPGNVDRIVPLLNGAQVDELKAYARGIAATKAERDQNKHWIFSNAFTTSVPDENLVTIRNRFGQTAA